MSFIKKKLFFYFASSSLTSILLSNTYLPLSAANYINLYHQARTINKYQYKKLISNNIKNNKFLDVDEFNKRSKYLLGPGDTIFMRIDYTNIQGKYTVNIDGNLYLPKIDNVYVTGLTLDEIKSLITEKYKKEIIEPDIYIRISGYKGISFFVKGEVTIVL